MATKASIPPAMKPNRCRLLLGISAALAVALPAAQEQSIAASATAIAAYVRPKDPSGRPRSESYVFTEGKFFDGVTVDGSLAKADFAGITRTLAASLAKQNYFPSDDARTADLIIMVHWGTTTIYEDPMKDLNNEALQNAVASYNAAVDATGMADTNELNTQLGARDTAREGVQDSINRNALLLGYAKVLARERRELNPTNAELTMSNELNEERYFVILMAYDNHLRTKEKKAKLLWVTRLSVRSPGNNFTEALPALARVGSDVFGRNIDDLVRVKSRIGTVKLGELEIVGTVPDNPPAKPDK